MNFVRISSGTVIDMDDIRYISHGRNDMYEIYFKSTIDTHLCVCNDLYREIVNALVQKGILLDMKK